MTLLNDAQTIYFGILRLASDYADELQIDKLFVLRAASVPPDQWTNAMVQESMRVVTAYVGLLDKDFPGTRQLAVRAQALTPSIEAYEDARNLSHGPQLDASPAPAIPKPVYDIVLDRQYGFANFHRYVPKAEYLPGWQQNGSVWLSLPLRQFIADHQLDVQPGVLEAISDYTESISAICDDALDFEIASSCIDPANYPPALEQMLAKE